MIWSYDLVQIMHFYITAEFKISLITVRKTRPKIPFS